MDELPPLIFDPRAHKDGAATLQTLFSRVCNETPATTELIGRVLVDLREQKDRELHQRGAVPSRAAM